MRLDAPGKAVKGAQAIGTGHVRLRVLATSDLHMHLLPWDYYTDRPARGRGLSLVAGLVARARAEVPLCLLVDNGDFLQGSPIGDLLADQPRSAPVAPNPMIAAMNHLGYDAANLGNHEFSHGIDFLHEALSAARFPVLSANILRQLGQSAAQDEPLALPNVLPHVLLRREVALADGRRAPLSIGLLGLGPPQVIEWEREAIGGRMAARDMGTAAEHHRDKLRRDGADLVIALAHSGIGSGGPIGTCENNVATLARDFGFDAIVAGHTHHALPGPQAEGIAGYDNGSGLLHGCPVVMPGHYGSHLGVIDFWLRPPEGDGDRWQVAQHHAALWPVARRGSRGRLRASAPEDPGIGALAQEIHMRTRRWSRRKIGRTAVPLSTHFALIGPSAAMRVVARAQVEHVEKALRGSLWQGLPVLAAASPFRSGGRAGPENFTHIPPGPVSLRQIADLYQFPNTIVAVLMTGVDLVEWLERAVSIYRRLAPSTTAVDLIDPEMPGFDFDMITGLGFSVDLGQPARYGARGELRDPGAHRIGELWHDGNPVAPDARFVLATNSYRLGGGGAYPGLRADRAILRGGQGSRAILASYLSREGVPPEPSTPEWRLTAPAGSAAIFATAPEARIEAAPAGLRLTALELDDQGFRRFRLDF